VRNVFARSCSFLCMQTLQTCVHRSPWCQVLGRRRVPRRIRFTICVKRMYTVAKGCVFKNVSSHSDLMFQKQPHTRLFLTAGRPVPGPRPWAAAPGPPRLGRATGRRAHLGRAPRTGNPTSLHYCTFLMPRDAQAPLTAREARAHTAIKSVHTMPGQFVAEDLLVQRRCTPPMFGTD